MASEVTVHRDRRGKTIRYDCGCIITCRGPTKRFRFCAHHEATVARDICAAYGLTAPGTETEADG